MCTLILPTSTYYRGEALPRKLTTTLTIWLSLLTWFSSWCNFRQETLLPKLQVKVPSGLGGPSAIWHEMATREKHGKHLHNRRVLPMISMARESTVCQQRSITYLTRAPATQCESDTSVGNSREELWVGLFFLTLTPMQGIAETLFSPHSAARATPQHRRSLSSSKQHGPSTHTAELMP